MDNNLLKENEAEKKVDDLPNSKSKEIKKSENVAASNSSNNEQKNDKAVNNTQEVQKEKQSTIVKEASKIIEEKNIEIQSQTKSATKKNETNESKKPNTTEKKSNKNMQMKKYKTKSKKKKIVIGLIIVLLLLAILLLSTVFGLSVSKSNTIASGVSICGIDVSKLSQSQAIEKLNTELSGKLDKELTLNHKDYSTKLETKTLNPTYDVESAVSEAYDIGRSGSNIFENNFKVLGALINKTNIAPEINYDEKLFDEAVDKLNHELPDRVINPSYKIDGNNLIVSNSSSGNRIQVDTFKSDIQNALANDNLTIELPVEQYEADSVDIDAIYKEVHKEPVDATFTTNPYQIHKEENGLDFDITLEQARELISKPQETYTIPLKVLTPKVTVKGLPQEAFPDQLGTYSTTYASSNYNRSSNIALAAKSVNNYVLMPGETFSYNGTVGQRTAARGYKEAGVYVNGEVSTDYGGGICQVSSTIYNAVLLANLEIVARTNHTFIPAYVPAGQDATVSWGSPDFQFKNNRSYPVRIVTSAGGGHITASVYGLKSDDDYEVKIVSNRTGTIPFSTEYKDDSSLPAGTTKVTQSGSNGCRSETYKILYKNGVEVSRKLINSDTYKPHNQVVLRGTKVVSTPDPTPTPNNNGGGNDQPVQDNTSNTPSTNENSSVTITNVPSDDE
ncbi:MAG: VanW family protein [Clostridia bacterium]|nr:VanW family protein [Clostridia bacterium]